MKTVAIVFERYDPELGYIYKDLEGRGLQFAFDNYMGMYNTANIKK
jgi:hypothetical protein